MKKKFDIVSIGDCAIDAFVEVEEATTHCNLKTDHCEICFSFADKIPYKSLSMQSAGNANNVAVGMSRLGLRSAFYGSIGDDANGKVIMNTLRKEDVSTKFMNVQKNVQTNFHVVLAFQGERTILIKHQDFKYELPKGIADASWIYLTSVGLKGLPMHAKLTSFLKSHPEIKMAFNPGTYQLRMGLKKLLPLFKRTEILFLNKEEARLLLQNNDDPKDLAEQLRETGPDTVIITDGLKGAYCLHGGIFHYIGIYPHKIVESTGCGDAFATGFTAAFIHGLPVEEALRWGGRNGASVATKVGPQEGLMTKTHMLKDLRTHKQFKSELKS